MGCTRFKWTSDKNDVIWNPRTCKIYPEVSWEIKNCVFYYCTSIKFVFWDCSSKYRINVSSIDREEPLQTLTSNHVCSTESALLISFLVWVELLLRQIATTKKVHVVRTSCLKTSCLFWKNYSCHCGQLKYTTA